MAMKMKAKPPKRGLYSTTIFDEGEEVVEIRIHIPKTKFYPKTYDSNKRRYNVLKSVQKEFPGYKEIEIFEYVVVDERRKFARYSGNSTSFERKD